MDTFVLAKIEADIDPKLAQSVLASAIRALVNEHCPQLAEKIQGVSVDEQRVVRFSTTGSRDEIRSFIGRALSHYTFKRGPMRDIAMTIRERLAWPDGEPVTIKVGDVPIGRVVNFSIGTKVEGPVHEISDTLCAHEIWRKFEMKQLTDKLISEMQKFGIGYESAVEVVRNSFEPNDLKHLAATQLREAAEQEVFKFGTLTPKTFEDAKAAIEGHSLLTAHREIQRFEAMMFRTLGIPAQYLNPDSVCKIAGCESFTGSLIDSGLCYTHHLQRTENDAEEVVGEADAKLAANRRVIVELLSVLEAVVGLKAILSWDDGPTSHLVADREFQEKVAITLNAARNALADAPIYNDAVERILGRVECIENLYSKTTEGRWEAEHIDDMGYVVAGPEMSVGNSVFLNEHDAEFCADSKEDIPWLVRIVRALINGNIVRTEPAPDSDDRRATGEGRETGNRER